MICDSKPLSVAKDRAQWAILFRFLNSAPKTAGTQPVHKTCTKHAPQLRFSLVQAPRFRACPRGLRC